MLPQWFRIGISIHWHCATRTQTHDGESCVWVWPLCDWETRTSWTPETGNTRNHASTEFMKVLGTIQWKPETGNIQWNDSMDTGKYTYSIEWFKVGEPKLSRNGKTINWEHNLASYGKTLKVAERSNSESTTGPQSPGQGPPWGPVPRPRSPGPSPRSLRRGPRVPTSWDPFIEPIWVHMHGHGPK